MAWGVGIFHCDKSSVDGRSKRVFDKVVMSVAAAKKIEVELG
jgi:hypothetical protein